MKAAILAMSALVGMMGMTACNREAKDGGEGGASNTTEKIKEEARETGREIGQATDKAVDKTKEETRQAARDVKEGAEKLVSKTEQGAKQAGGAAKEKEGAAKQAAGGLMPGDDAETDSDRQLVAKIRMQLAADKEIASEARDVRIDADSGKVELEGTVTSQEAKAKIGRVVGRLAGPKNVKDELKVAEQVGTGNTER